MMPKPRCVRCAGSYEHSNTDIHAMRVLAQDYFCFVLVFGIIEARWRAGGFDNGDIAEVLDRV